MCKSCTEKTDLVYAFINTCLGSWVLQKQLPPKQEVDECIDDGHEFVEYSDTEDKPYICDICNESCESEDILNVHKSEHLKPEEFTCYHCSEVFRDKEILTRHLQSEHSTISEETVTKRRRNTKFTCEDCAKVLSSSKKLIEHAIEEHKKDRHLIKPFQCPKCGSRFASSSNLVQHRKYHEGNRTNICSYCGKGFITSSDLINHEKQHLNKREYKCEVCCKEYNTHKDLRTHRILKHKDRKTWNYHCGLCDKYFHIKPNYDNHMRRHVGDKRFVCHLCEKPFVTKDELNKHFTSHSNVRAFRCTLCPKEYKDRRILNIHMVKVHGIGTAKVPVRERKHLCSTCPKAFVDHSKLVRHMLTHSGQRPHKCGVCERSFTDKSYVKHHRKVAHGIVENSDS